MKESGQKIAINRLAGGIIDPKASRFLERIKKQFGNLALTPEEVAELGELNVRFDPRKAAEFFREVTSGRGSGKSHRQDHDQQEDPRQNRPKGDKRISRMRTNSRRPLRLDRRDRQSFWMKEDDEVK